MRTLRVVSLSVSVLAPMSVLASPPPRLLHARVETGVLAGTLEATVRAWAAAQSSPAWLGYEVPATGRHQMCCFESVESASAAGVGRCSVERVRSGRMKEQL